MKIGYIGLGAMGGQLARHLLKDHELAVADLNASAVAEMLELGAKACGSPAELGEACDVIVTCLPRSQDVRRVLFGSDGLAAGLKAGKLVIDQTSGVPQETASMASELAQKGVLMMDAPVSGGIPAVKAGTITILGSGTDEAWARGREVLEAMSNSVYRCSTRVGDGQGLKLVNNAMGAGYRMATLQLVAFGRKHSLALRDMVEFLNAGPAANFTTRGMLAALLEGRSTTNFALALMIKDLNEAIRMGAQCGVPMPMTMAARGIMQVGLNLFGKDARLDDVIPLTEKLAGITLVESETEGGTAPRNEGLLLQIARAVEVCNRLVILECVAAGARFGLEIGVMAEVLTIGSAWSRASEALLPSLAAETDVDPYDSFADAVADLGELAHAAALSHVSMTLPDTAWGLMLTAANLEVGSRNLVGATEKLSGVTFAS